MSFTKLTVSARFDHPQSGSAIVAGTLSNKDTMDALGYEQTFWQGNVLVVVARIRSDQCTSLRETLYTTLQGKGGMDVSHKEAPILGT
jgi:hypothetical protein